MSTFSGSDVEVAGVMKNTVEKRCGINKIICPYFSSPYDCST
jgi:hypothetical protein